MRVLGDVTQHRPMFWGKKTKSCQHHRHNVFVIERFFRFPKRHLSIFTIFNRSLSHRNWRVWNNWMARAIIKRIYSLSIMQFVQFVRTTWILMERSFCPEIVIRNPVVVFFLRSTFVNVRLFKSYNDRNIAMR